MPKKKTSSKVKEEPAAKPEKLANLWKQTSDEIDDIFASKKRKNPSTVKEEPAAKPAKLANQWKQAADEIDEIFASKKKRKNAEAKKSQKPEDNVKKDIPKKENEKKKRKKSEGSRRKTNDGLQIYQVDELGINKPGSGFSPLCPFDCSCCF